MLRFMQDPFWGQIMMGVLTVTPAIAICWPLLRSRQREPDPDPLWWKLPWERDDEMGGQ